MDVISAEISGAGKITADTGSAEVRLPVTVPDALPNPHPLRFTGAVSAEYDGSRSMTVRIPSEGRPGADGRSAYQVAADNGFDGTEAEWLQSLVGPAGPQGQPGQDGRDGQPGAAGESAYDIAVKNGFEGTEAEWSASIVETAEDISKARNNVVFVTGEQPDGTIADILKEYQRRRDTMRIVYIKLDDGDATPGQSWSSDAACIITKNANIMVDFGRIQDYDRIRSALLENSVTRLDYIFLSHYHHDHCGCMNENKAGSAAAAEAAGTSLTTLWADSDIDTSGCVLVLPADAPTSLTNSTEPQWIKRLIDGLIAANNITAAKPAYEGGYWSVDNAVHGEAPVWSQVKPSGGAIIRAHNCTDDFVAQYASHGDYNETSTVLEVELGHTLATFTGDSSHMTQAALTDRLRMTDILKLGHHVTDADWHRAFYEKLSPRYVIASVDQDHFENYIENLAPAGSTYHRPAIAWVAGQRIPLYPLAASGTCIFESDGRRFELVSNNRSHQPKTSGGTLLAAFPDGVAVNGEIDLSDTGWESFTLFMAQLSTSSNTGIGTGVVLAKIYTSAGVFLRGVGGTGISSGLDSYFCTLNCTTGDDVFTVAACDRLVHTTAGSHTSYNNTNKVIALYGLC